MLTRAPEHVRHSHRALSSYFTTTRNEEAAHCRAGVSKLQPRGQIQPVITCFCVTWDQRRVFVFLNDDTLNGTISTYLISLRFSSATKPKLVTTWLFKKKSANPSTAEQRAEAPRTTCSSNPGSASEASYPSELLLSEHQYGRHHLAPCRVV